MHPSSLYGEYSVGSFGKEGFEFVDFLYECGFSVWQTLPFCMTDEFNSPYKSPASFSLNPFFIDLPTLSESGYISDSELKSARQKNEYRCEFERLKSQRIPLLFKAAERAMSDKVVAGKVSEFIFKNPRIDAASKFLALKSEYGDVPFQKWEKREPSEREADKWRFLNYEFYRQWQCLKSYANKKGIEIMGDLPIYVSEDSADVWEFPESFLLDAKGYPLEVAGVPPDYFSADGQLWGNPIYNYGLMERDGFSWWKERIRFAFSLFDSVRIDHFRGLDAYFSIPIGKSAREGKWKEGPGASLVSALREESGEKKLIAEDLGIIDGSVRELMQRFSLPGMRVFEFAFLDGSDSEHLPHNYNKDTVAYTGTHDNNPLLAYLFECSPGERSLIFDYCGYGGTDIDEAVRYIVRAMMASSAGTVIFPIQDILGHGRDTRMNTPSVCEGNWGYRITEGQLDRVDRKGLRALCETYKRI